MSTIVTRAGKGSPLTHAEVDSNFTNLNSDKVEASAGTLTNPSIAGVASFADGSASAPAITNTGDTNTGIFFPAADTIAFSEGGTEAMRLDSSGNLGLGVTPSAWASFPAMQVGARGAFWSSTGSGSTFVSNNAYYNAGFKYIQTGVATAYEQGTGLHAWYTAASGTAGNAITFTQAMTLDASGNLGIRATSPNAQLTLKSPSTTGDQSMFAIQALGSSTKLLQMTINQATDTYTFGTDVAGSLAFQTNATERMRIDSSGNLLVGTTTAQGNTSTFAADGNQKPVIALNNTNSVSQSDQSVRFVRNGSTVGTITTTLSATAYNTSSDYRLKNNQATLTGSGAFIDALQPKTWTWTVDGSAGTGFIAHEVQAISPNSVTGEKDAVDAEGNPVMQSMEYGSAEFIANIVAELQDLRKRVSALETK